MSNTHHFGGFVLAGVLALVVDLAILNALIGLGVPPLVGRILSIPPAMVTSWWINRTVTFAMKTQPTVQEFAMFATVSLGSIAVNYTLFVVLLTVLPLVPAAIGLERELDLGPTMMPGVIASLAVMVAASVSMFVSYAGFRFAVFHKSQ